MLKLTHFFYRLGDHTIDFVSTAFLATIWASAGFNLWKVLMWPFALGMWVLYLFPVILGYYLARVVEDIERDVYLRAISELESGSTADEIHKTQDDLFDLIVELNKRYKRVGILGIVFVGFVLVDVVITICFYIKGLI